MFNEIKPPLEKNREPTRHFLHGGYMNTRNDKIDYQINKIMYSFNKLKYLGGVLKAFEKLREAGYFDYFRFSHELPMQDPTDGRLIANRRRRATATNGTDTTTNPTDGTDTAEPNDGDPLGTIDN